MKRVSASIVYLAGSITLVGGVENDYDPMLVILGAVSLAIGFATWIAPLRPGNDVVDREHHGK